MISGIQFDETQIDAIFSEINRSHLPGAAVGIAIRGKPVYRKGFGLASLDLPLTLSPSVRLRIGSVTKQFTALAYMLLCEEGKATLDDEIGHYLPELPAISRRVTARQLLTNTSGLRDVYQLFKFSDSFSRNGGPALTTTSKDLYEFYCAVSDANAAPDTDWIYNNGGWLLLSLAIERISGTPMEQIVSDRIFSPIGMHDSIFRRTDTDFVHNSAAQHVGNPIAGFQKIPWGVDNFLGAGAIVSTVDDLLRWLAHMDNPTVGSAETWSLIRTPHVLSNNCSCGYGFGVFLDNYRGVPTIHHAGGAYGGNARVLKVPSIGLDVVVIVNREDVDSTALSNRILDACLPQLTPNREPLRGHFCTGVFGSPRTGRIIRCFEHDGRRIVSVNGFSMIATARDGDTIPLTSLWSSTHHHIALRGDQMNPTALHYSAFGNVDELLPLAPAMEHDDSISGRYICNSVCGIDVRISRDVGEARLDSRGPFGSAVYRLECLAKDVWRATPLRQGSPSGGILYFKSAEPGFRYSNYSTYSLPFHRVE